MNELAKAPLFADGPTVSRLCLGTMMFGDQTDGREAASIFEAFTAVGGNLIDTADSYAGGSSEAMLGRLLAHTRDRFFLATKVGNPIAGVEGSGGLSAGWIKRAAAMSLDRLRTDRIDLYYLHLEDDQTPLEDTISALGELISSGTVGAWGFSNFRPWKIAEMVRLADRLGVPRPVAAQPYYHLLNRTAEADTIPACRHFGIGIACHSPLARGVLTGKYRNGPPQGSRVARGDRRMSETEFFPETLERANRAADHAGRTGRSLSALALNWVLANDAVSSVLIGPKTLTQLHEYVSALETGYTPKDEAFLSSLCAAGDTPVPGHNDPRYPLDGRRVKL